MSRLNRVSPASLKGDDGWRLRDAYSDLIKDIEKYLYYFKRDMTLYIYVCNIVACSERIIIDLFSDVKQTLFVIGKMQWNQS